MKKVYENRYFKIGLAIFIAGALLIIFYQMVTSFSGFRSGLQSIVRVLSPFIYGFIMAYLMNPTYNFVTRVMYKATRSKFKTHAKAFVFSQAVATAVSVLIMLGIVIGLMALIIPQLIQSITGIIDALPGRMVQLDSLIRRFTASIDNQVVANNIIEFWESAEDKVIDWAKDTLMPGLGTLMQKISAQVLLTLKTLLNMVIGVIVCVYFLNGKDKFKAQVKKIVTALFKPEAAREIFELGSFTDHAFSGFITG